MKRLKVLTKLQEIHPFAFYSCFTVSATPLINTLIHPALTAPFLLIFILYLFIAFEVILLTNPGKLPLAKEIAIFVSAFFPKLLHQELAFPLESFTSCFFDFFKNC